MGKGSWMKRFLWQYLIHFSHCLIQKLITWYKFFSNAAVHYSNQCSKILHISECENKQVPAKTFHKRVIFDVEPRWLDSLITSQNAYFGQDKNSMNRLPINSFHFSQENTVFKLTVGWTSQEQQESVPSSTLNILEVVP